MSASIVDFELCLGTPIPQLAPAWLVERLQSARVQFADDHPGTFQLVFHADRDRGLSEDFDVLSTPLLESSSRVVLSVILNGTKTVLMDGFVTHVEFSHASDFGSSVVTVTGEDVSVLMDLIDVPDEFAGMGDSEIARLVLAKYTMVGIVPVVVPSPRDVIPIPIERTPQQNSTDRSLLKELAANNGYVFHVRPGPEPLTNIAFFGPPLRLSHPKTPLSIDMGSMTNVDRLDFAYDSLAPTQVFGFVQDTLTDERLPVLAMHSTRLPEFAERPALGLAKLFERRQIYTDPQFGIAKAQVDAQATTDKSTDRVVVGRGSIDGVRYGDVLEAPGVVEVRGAGSSFDGKYYVQSVMHVLSRGTYRQGVTLTREGLGSTISHVSISG